MYLMPEVFEETFRDLGLMMETGARGNNCSMEGDRINHPLDRLNRCSTNALIHFHDDTELRMSSDLASLKTELEAIEPGCFPRQVIGCCLIIYYLRKVTPFSLSADSWNGSRWPENTMIRALKLCLENTLKTWVNWSLAGKISWPFHTLIYTENCGNGPAPFSNQTSCDEPLPINPCILACPHL